MEIYWKITGAAAATLTMFGFLPQLLKTFKSKAVDDLSIGTLYQFAAGTLLWMAYGIHIKDWIVIIANIVTFLTIALLLGLYFAYRRK